MTAPAPWRQPAFRSLWLAGLISNTGDWLLFIALPIVVYRLTGSALGTSVAFLVELTPGIVLAPLAGWCADRWNRRRTLITVSVLQAAALVPLLIVPTRVELPVIYAVILAEAALSTVFDPVKNALLPTLVPSTDLVSANSLIGLGQNLARFVGGPLGGVVLATGGLRAIVAADLISYLTAAAIITRVNNDPPSVRPRRPSAAAVPAPGAYRSMLRSRPIRATLLVTVISQIAQGIFVVLFILFVTRQLHGGSRDVGLLRGVQAVGAVIGGVVLASIARRYQPGVLTASAAIAFGVVDLVLWNASLLSTNMMLFVILFIVLGAPGIVLETALISVLQLHTDNAHRGRAFSALGLAGNLGQAVGMIIAGLLTAPLGLLTILNTQAVLYLAAGGVAAWSMTGQRSRRHAATEQVTTRPPVPTKASQ